MSRVFARGSNGVANARANYDASAIWTLPGTCSKFPLCVGVMHAQSVTVALVRVHFALTVRRESQLAASLLKAIQPNSIPFMQRHLYNRLLNGVHASRTRSVRLLVEERRRGGERKQRREMKVCHKTGSANAAASNSEQKAKHAGTHWELRDSQIDGFVVR